MDSDTNTHTPTITTTSTAEETRRTPSSDVNFTAAVASGGNRFAGGWGPVLSGAVSAFMAFVILSSLWLALAGSGADFISGNFGWWELLSVLVAAPFGGYVAGRLQPSGDRTTAGLQGFATWGLLILVGLFVGVPSGAALFSGATDLTLQGAAEASGSLAQFDEQLWGVFAVFAGGALLAAMGGAAGARAGRDDDDHDAHHDTSNDSHTGRRTLGDDDRTRR